MGNTVTLLREKKEKEENERKNKEKENHSVHFLRRRGQFQKRAEKPSSGREAATV